MPKTSAEPTVEEVRRRLAGLANECRSLATLVKEAWNDGRLKGSQWHGNADYLLTLELTFRCINTKEPTDEQDER